MKKENKTDNIIEGEVFEKENNRTNNKKSVDKSTIIVILCCILAGTVVVINILTRFNILEFNVFDSEKSNKNDVELKYTETNDNDIEGVYITDVSEVVENVMPSIVAITSKSLVSTGQFGFNYFGGTQYTEGAGSGIIVSQSDTELLIVTNYHVVEGTTELTVQFIDEESCDASIKGVSERKDIAVISVPLSSLKDSTLDIIKLATIGDSDNLKVGNGIIAIGNALGYGQSVTTGVVSALDREVTIDNYTNKMIQIDAAINGGNSGGALLNSSGEVVGINSAKYSSSGSSTSASIEGMGFAIPISDVSELITTLMNGENDDGGATIGVEGYIITEQYSVYYNRPTGFYITNITAGSGADKANLEIGNIITKIEGETVTKFSDLSDILYEKEAGDKVTLTIKYVSGREYKEKDVVVELS